MIYGWSIPPLAGCFLCCIFVQMLFPSSLQMISLGHTQMTLFVPDEEAVKKAWQNGSITFPYWSKVWPSAIALSNFLLLNPSYISNKKVLEVGAGLGLPSLVAAGFASEVLCTDYNDEALKYVYQSAQHHRLANFKTALLDWQYLNEDYDADVLLLSDISYDPSAFDSLQKMINLFLEKKTTIILSTPQRLMAKEFINAIQPYSIQQQEMLINDKAGENPVTIIVLKKSCL